MQLTVHKSLSTGQRYLVDKHNTVATSSQYVTATWRISYRRQLTTMHIQGLLYYVVEHRIKYFQTAILCTS